MEVLGVLEILGKCLFIFEFCFEIDIIKVVMGSVLVYCIIMYIMFGIFNLRSVGIIWFMTYGRIIWFVFICFMFGWIGLNRGRVFTCFLIMGRVCKICSVRRLFAGFILGFIGLLGFERDEKDYIFI